MSRRGLLIVLSGPSGCGKGTVVGKLLTARNDVCVSVSCTTRAPREGEREGVHYFYKSREQFTDMIRDHALLEYAEYSGTYYGTPKAWVEERLADGMHVILEIDVQGGQNIMRLCPDAVSVFLLPPSVDVLKARLVGRCTESTEVVQQRMDAAVWELSQADTYHYQVINDDLETTVAEINAIIDREQIY